MDIFFGKIAVSCFLCCWVVVSPGQNGMASPACQQSTQQVTGAESTLDKVDSAFPVIAPEVVWDIDWAITRKRPGYPLLEGAEHFSIHPPSAASGAYHHHPQIFYFGSRFFVVWSNHPSGEDGPGQRVIGAVSDDGKSWAPIGTIFDRCDRVNTSTANGRALVAAPFLVVGGRLFAAATINDGVGFGKFDTPVTGKPLSMTKTRFFGKRIRRALGYLLREIHSDNSLGPVFWMGRVRPDPIYGFGEFPLPENLSPSILSALLRGLKHPATRSPWAFDLPDAEFRAADGSLVCEPTTKSNGDGLMIRYLRDLAGSQKLYVQFSHDEGATWTPAKRTEIPDAPSKSVLGRLPDGQFFLIGNQVVSKRGTRRDPLTIGLSDDGTVFKKAFAIRWRTPPFQTPSQQTEPDGRGRGFQYPSCVIANGALWVIYSVNKESIAVSRIGLQDLAR